MSDTTHSPIDPLVDAIARRVVELLRPSTPIADDSAPMTAAAIVALRPGVSAGWLRSHVVEVGRGARRTPLYRLVDVDAALAGAAHPPKPPQKPILTGINEDPIDAMVRRGELRAARGGR